MLHYAVRAGAVDIVTYLLECGADPLASNVMLQTSLHIACAGKSADIVRSLAEGDAGQACALVMDSNGQTPFDVAEASSPALLPTLVASVPEAFVRAWKCLKQG